MKSGKVAKNVRTYVHRARPGSFIWARDLMDRFGSPVAVEVALSRLTSSDTPLVRVRNGLYWRAPVSRFGKATPRPLEVAVEVANAGRGGVGPAGWTALRMLGLSTQLPAKEEVAVVGPAPSEVPGVIFRSRTNPARADLRFHEIATLEALRAAPPPDSDEWAKVVATVNTLVKDRVIRWNLIRRAATREPPGVRTLVTILDKSLPVRLGDGSLAA
jgi:hypothetical protein